MPGTQCAARVWPHASREGTVSLKAWQSVSRRRATARHTHRRYIPGAAMLLTALLVIARIPVSDAEPESVRPPELRRWEAQWRASVRRIVSI